MPKLSEFFFKDFSSELLNGLRMPFAIIVPLNDYCVLNMSDKGRTPTLVIIPVGYYGKFRVTCVTQVVPINWLRHNIICMHTLQPHLVRFLLIRCTFNSNQSNY